MLDYYDEILLEQYITSKNMSKKERDICMYYIRNLVDVTNSKYYINDEHSRSYQVVSIDFSKEDNTILFNGSLSSEEESKWIDGKIVNKDNGVVVFSNYYRLNEFVDEDSKDYSTVDMFVMLDDGVIKRQSAYSDDDKFSISDVVFDEDELNNYYKKLIGKFDKGLTLK